MKERKECARDERVATENEKDMRKNKKRKLLLFVECH